MRKHALASLVVLFVVGCGGGADVGGGDVSDIRRSVDAYFVLDTPPTPSTYCRSYVELQRSDNFRAGNLTEDAQATESKCLRAFALVQPTHTGWPEAQIRTIDVDGDRGHAMVTYRFRGHTVTRNAWVGRVDDGDWRVLNAGYD
jgi:hypothetical protein